LDHAEWHDNEVLVSFDVVFLFMKAHVDLTVSIARRSLLACEDLSKCAKLSVDETVYVRACLRSCSMNLTFRENF